MRGKDFALIDQPPNHRLFDHDSDATKLTPLLRKHLEDANLKNAKAANDAPPTGNTAPTINFSIGKELVNLLCLPAPVADSLAPPVYTAPIPQNSFDIGCPTLLQTNWKIGPDMTLEAFCTKYELDDAIQDHFKEHWYKHAHMFRYLTMKDMEVMKFWAGEIAEVRDAIDSWSVAA